MLMGVVAAEYAESCTPPAAAEGAASKEGVPGGASSGAPMPRVVTLSWAPGPMATALSADMRCSALHSPTAAMFDDMEARGAFVDPKASADKLVRLLRGAPWKPAAHVDFYDLE